MLPTEKKCQVFSTQEVVPKINDCEVGTYMTYFSAGSNLVESFICLKCDIGKHKIVKLHKLFMSIPFDVEENIGEFNRNLQTPYFVCGDVNVEVPECEFYMDYSYKIALADGNF